MFDPASRLPFSILGYPYRTLVPVTCPPAANLRELAVPGAALVWQVARSKAHRHLEAARARPGGMALIVVLPPARELGLNGFDVLTLIDRCRPHSVLPFHLGPEPEDLAVVLRRPPEALSVEVSDYLTWRGIRVDGDTRRLLRRTVELSGELSTVTGLSRAVYLSRRALGRRFLSRGLPAPSHWLQFGRVLRAAIQLQTTEDSLFTVSSDLGYPDGFALSNQMKRLTGVRPSLARQCLGWEWLVEAWLRQEQEAGGLHFDLVGSAAAAPRKVAEPLSTSNVPTWRGTPTVAAGRTDS